MKIATKINALLIVGFVTQLLISSNANAYNWEVPSASDDIFVIPDNATCTVAETEQACGVAV